MGKGGKRKIIIKKKWLLFKDHFLGVFLGVLIFFLGGGGRQGTAFAGACVQGGGVHTRPTRVQPYMHIHRHIARPSCCCHSTNYSSDTAILIRIAQANHAIPLHRHESYFSTTFFREIQSIPSHHPHLLTCKKPLNPPICKWRQKRTRIFTSTEISSHMQSRQWK